MSVSAYTALAFYLGQFQFVRSRRLRLPNKQFIQSSRHRSTRGKAVITISIRLRYHYDTTTIRRYNDSFDYDGSDRNYDLRSIRLLYDYDPTTTYRARLLSFDAIRREQKMTSIFRRSRIYRSRIVVESQL